MATRSADKPSRLSSRGADGAGGWLASACRLILNVRMGILVVTLLSLGQEEHRALTAAAIVVAAVASLYPVLRWDKVGPALVRHPSYLAGELVLAVLILVLTGVDSPFFFYTLGTALLGGLVYGYAGAARPPRRQRRSGTAPAARPVCGSRPAWSRTRSGCRSRTRNRRSASR